MSARFIFLGTPHFAVPVLRALASDERFDVVLVVTQPDRRAGRGRKMQSPPVAQVARELELDIFQPISLREPASVKRLAAAEPDLLVLASYGEILRKDVLDLAPAGVLNIHPSLLPKYRGASPVPAAILNGDSETGISIIKLVSKLDAGPILAAQRVAIHPHETAGELSNRLAQLAAELTPDVCHQWLAGEIKARPQDDELATFTREWTKDDGRIDWHQPACAIERLVRAAQPWPVAWTVFEDQQVRVYRAHVDPSRSDMEPGHVRQDRREIRVATGNGTLILERVQPAGKREMDAIAWWNGLRLESLTFE